MSRVDVDVQLKFQTTAIRRINNGAKAAIREVMDTEVLPLARDLSPKGPESVNADSLTSRTKQQGSVIVGSIMSHSGHGGYLEKGTSKMAPRPYIWPAFERAIPKLKAILQRRIAQFAQLDQEVEDGGVDGLGAKLKAGLFKRPRQKKASK